MKLTFVCGRLTCRFDLKLTLALWRNKSAGLVKTEKVQPGHNAQGCKSACCCVCATNTQMFYSVHVDRLYVSEILAVCKRSYCAWISRIDSGSHVTECS